jgi:hypothetical protein
LYVQGLSQVHLERVRIRQAAGQFDAPFPLARSEFGEIFEGKKHSSQDPALNIDVEVGAFGQLQRFVYLALSQAEVESAGLRLILELHLAPPLLFLMGTTVITTASFRPLL